MYFPQCIKAGMVYKAIPPLYSIQTGNKKKYFVENLDFVRYIQKEFNKNYNVTDMKGNKISDKDMAKFFISNADYIYYLEDVAETYKVNSHLLEMVLNSYISNKDTFDIKKISKEINSAYRFMSVDEKHNTVVGTIEGSNFIPLNNKFISDCTHILNMIRNNDLLQYKVNGEKCTIYDIMKLYDKSIPSKVQRYKGLGEMPKSDLKESTLDPDSRTLLRYTMESAKEDIEFIREYESNPRKILEHVGDITRNDLIE